MRIGETPVIDELTNIVAGSQPSNRRELAVTILRYVAQQRQSRPTQNDVDHAVAETILELQVSSLWSESFIDHLVIVRKDGVERLEIVKENKMTDESLAVPMPVIPPSDAEKAAIAGMTLPTPEQTATTVERLEQEGAVLREMREQPLTPEEAVVQAQAAQEKLSAALAEVERLKTLAGSL